MRRPKITFLATSAVAILFNHIVFAEPAKDIFTSIFLQLTSAYHTPPTCSPPNIVFDTDKIANDCQKVAKAGNNAIACYSPSTTTIYLRTLWDEDSTYDLDAAEYEERRHITEACLHRPFNPTNRKFSDVLKEERQKTAPLPLRLANEGETP